MTEDQFAKLVDRALASIPEGFRQFMENLTVEILPRPTPRLMRRLQMRGGRTLLGLYSGRSLLNKTVEAPFEYPETIFIFQENIEAICETDDEVVEQVRTTVLHEIGHHFGMDEDDLDELGFA